MFDFSSAIAAAAAVVERQEQKEGGSQSYKYPLVYPQAGQVVTVRPLFNPKSGQILRLVNRHEKVACYRTYGVDCPICKVMQQVKDMTGQDPFGRTKKSKSRGFCFAQYVSSSYQIEKSQNSILQPGEIILFMFPWSVYSQINTTIQAISQTPTGMDQAFCHASTGMTIQVSVSADFKYSTVNVPYMTYPWAVGQSDDDFMKLIEEIDSLNDQVLPSTITEEVDKQVREYTDAIYRQFISPSVPNQGQPSPVPAQFTPQQVPQAPAAPQQFTGYPPVNISTTTTPAPTAAVPAYQVGQSSTPSTPPWGTTSQPAPQGRPSCFGSHVDSAPKCICCPEEMVCIQNSMNK